MTIVILGFLALSAFLAGLSVRVQAKLNRSDVAIAFWALSLFALICALGGLLKMSGS